MFKAKLRATGAQVDILGVYAERVIPKMGPRVGQSILETQFLVVMNGEYVWVHVDAFEPPGSGIHIPGSMLSS